MLNSLNIVPIINTNDAVSPPMFIEHDEATPGSGSKKVSGICIHNEMSFMLSCSNSSIHPSHNRVRIEPLIVKALLMRINRIRITILQIKFRSCNRY